MTTSFKREVSMALHNNWGYFLIWGIGLLILGLLAIYFASATTLISVVIIGMLFLLAGIIVMGDAIQFWRGKLTGFTLHLLMGLLYFITGIYLIGSPALGAVSLTLFLGSFFLVIGIFRIVYSLITRLTRWGWSFFSGLISIFLGIMILGGWPESSLFIIGLFLGIDLVFIGWTYIMIALAGKALTGKKT